MAKRLIRLTEVFAIELPFSEVCMHLRVAGSRMRARLEPNQMVQLLQPDGSRFSFPITAAEAGLHTDGQDVWVATNDEEGDWSVPDRAADTAVDDQPDPRRLLDSLSESLDVPDRRSWRGEVLDGPGGPLYWHPDLGYLSAPGPDDQP
jgi:hypothetical protein